MAKKGENRAHVSLRCTECNKHVSRPTERNKKNTTEKLSFSKYCPRCHRHTEHKETKI